MGRRLLSTPRSRVRQAIRQLWLRSRERAAALKAAGYCCERCGVKQSKRKGQEVKVEVHHKDGIRTWDYVIDAIFREILCKPDHLEVLCVKCHAEETAKETEVVND